ncbi:gene transfer agent family protein [Pararhizobium haloflavum]|uniref:gene transfer agent family protein n=1 Tax=Pararhizobium haloflavum TaxID=2037914 RepID=UPI000C192915|nr:gene transfer agent family protein [Pararhizobium haloflavum]
MGLVKFNANRRRGEIAARLDGEQRVLCLTLGALCELEDAFSAENLSDLVARFSNGRLSATDIIRIVGAGLRGGGHVLSDDDVAQMTIDGGVRGFAELASDLLALTFAQDEDRVAANP